MLLFRSVYTTQDNMYVKLLSYQTSYEDKNGRTTFEVLVMETLTVESSDMLGCILAEVVPDILKKDRGALTAMMSVGRFHPVIGHKDP